MSLVTGWWLMPDPDDVGVESGWSVSVAEGAREAVVPGIIGQVFPDAVGIAWYWAWLPPVRRDPDVRWWLRFGAVDYRATVWVDGHQLGMHENGETPFELDVTGVVADDRPTLLAVRVVAPGEETVDGLDLEHIPHRNKRRAGYHPGWLHAHGGILRPVALEGTPTVRVVDLHARPDAADGRVPVTATLENAAATAREVEVRIFVCAEPDGAVLDSHVQTVTLPAGRTTIDAVLAVAEPRRWELDDPCLYRVEAEVAPSDAASSRHRLAVRVGFRELRVVDGFFELNGRRILIRSSHTGNHYPVGQIVPPEPDLLRRDLINAKAAGFNMIRFMSGIAWPEQLDLCDELGLMIYEEPMGSWLLKDGPHLLERYDRSLRGMILRDRNHACVTVWGLLTETLDGRLFRHAVDRLGAVRDLDPTRLVMLNSGRFDAQPSIGSVANPGSREWEHVWGNEAPDAPGRTLVPDPATGWLTRDAWINGDLSLAGAIEGNGDTHTYPVVPHSTEAEAFLRGLGRDTRPHMLSEYGIGSLMNVIAEQREYERAGASPDLLDAALIASMAERFQADWQRFGLDDLYPFAEDFLIEAQRQHAGYRSLGFDLVRSNPRIPGFNVTGLLDHALTGEGFWTFWRRWKPGSFDALVDGWAPLRWCLFASSRHVHPGRSIHLEAVLADEHVLRPGSYEARVRLLGPTGITLDTVARFSIGVAGTDDRPLAFPVWDGHVDIPTVGGSATFAVELGRGGRPAGGRLAVRIADPLPSLPADTAVVGVGLDERTRTWLEERGVEVLDPGGPRALPLPMLVGPGAGGTEGAWPSIEAAVRAGAIALVLSPEALTREDDPSAWLPRELPGGCTSFYDWVYHREWVATRHRAFDGLPGPGLVSWDDYGPLLAPEMLVGMPECPDLAMAAFAVGYSMPGGYTSGIVAGSWPIGLGRLFIGTLRILPLLDRHPAADRILLNLISWAREAARA